MNRGEIWWASLPDAAGSMPSYSRPVLVIQADAFNRSRIQTVIVATLTSNLKLANAPGNVFVSTAESGLPRDSVINVSQVITVDKEILVENVSPLPAKTMRKVDEGLRLVLALI